MDNQLATIEHITPAQLMRQATDVAGLCKAIVTKTAKKIGDRKYVPIEGWQAVATAHGCMLSINLVEDIGEGIRAVAEVKRMENGAVLATAEGFVGHQEHPWSKRELYARRAMAQTRAMSRAARSAFAHVVILMDAGLETTPAEEIPLGSVDAADTNEPKRPVQQPQRKPQELKPVAGADLSIPDSDVPPGEGLDENTVTGLLQAVEKKKVGAKKSDKWGLHLQDGRWAGTFDSKLGQIAEDAFTEGKPVVVSVEKSSCAKYWNVLTVGLL